MGAGQAARVGTAGQEQLTGTLSLSSPRGSWHERAARCRQRKPHRVSAGTIQETEDAGWSTQKCTWKCEVDKKKNEVAGLTSSRL